MYEYKEGKIRNLQKRSEISEPGGGWALDTIIFI